MKQKSVFEEELKKAYQTLNEEMNDEQDEQDDPQDEREKKELDKLDGEVRKKKIEHKKNELKKLNKTNGSQL